MQVMWTNHIGEKKVCIPRHTDCWVIARQKTQPGQDECIVRQDENIIVSWKGGHLEGQYNWKGGKGQLKRTI